MNKLKILILSLASSLLVGCSFKKNTLEYSTVSEVSISTETDVNTNTIENVKNLPVIFNSFLDMPIISEGVLCGKIHVNFVEKLGIWDINNYQATQNGVNYCYAINCHIDMYDYLQSNEMINVTLNPILIDYGNNQVGSAGYVGWSGYASTAEVYANTTSADFEVILQPTTTDLNSVQYLVFNLADVNSQKIFEPLYCNLDCLLTASDGAQLKTIADTATIESINGALYSVMFHDVYLELHNVKKCANLSDGSYKFYDFQYDINYFTGPINDRSVMSFDSFNNNAITSAPIMEVYSDIDATKLYDEVFEAQRLMYSNRNKTELYVTKFPDFLNVGETATVSVNRLIPNTTAVKPTYLRIVLKFPAEVKARTLDEIRNFSGRYLVFQVPLNTRTLEEEPR